MFEKIPQNNKNILQESKKEKLSRFESLCDKSKIFIKRMEQLMLVLGIGMAVHYTEIKNDKVEKISQDEKEVFQHSDKETTHILNYVAGVDSLNYEERIELLKPELKIYYDKQHVPLPENFDSMNKEEFLSFCYSTEKNFYKNNKSETEIIADFMAWVEKTVPGGFKYDSTLYKLIWETEKECGAPHVRWTFGQSRDLSDGGGVAHYNQLNNTIYIHPKNFRAKDDPVNELIEEWPHAKQMENAYLETIIGDVEAAARIAEDMMTTHSFVTSQLKEYEILGSIEHNAHSVIEPQIQEKFKNISRAK